MTDKTNVPLPEPDGTLTFPACNYEEEYHSNSPAFSEETLIGYGNARAAEVALRWIPITEREPEIGQKVWYYFDVVGVHFGEYDGNGNFSGRSGFLGGQEVTHWMPGDLPAPPEKAETRGLTMEERKARMSPERIAGMEEARPLVRKRLSDYLALVDEVMKDAPDNVDYAGKNPSPAKLELGPFPGCPLCGNDRTTYLHGPTGKLRCPNCHDSP